jgi:hypothetical protein
VVCWRDSGSLQPHKQPCIALDPLHAGALARLIREVAAFRHHSVQGYPMRNELRAPDRSSVTGHRRMTEFACKYRFANCSDFSRRRPPPEDRKRSRSRVSTGSVHWSLLLAEWIRISRSSNDNFRSRAMKFPSLSTNCFARGQGLHGFVALVPWQ